MLCTILQRVLLSRHIHVLGESKLRQNHLGTKNQKRFYVGEIFMAPRTTACQILCMPTLEVYTDFPVWWAGAAALISCFVSSLQWKTQKSLRNMV